MQYTYEEVVERISGARRFGNQPGVEVTGQMLELLDHPERGIPYVHVAGTNGKGSVCAFLGSILSEAGKKTGVFTSPHLVDFRERIAVNGEWIPKEAVTRIGNRLLQTDFGVSATMFDYCLLMALLYFKEQECDILILETGLGGRLDSTNALGVPKAAVITKIGLDHTEILGDTIQQIAAEKAGIIKTGCPVIVETQQKEALDVIVKHFYEINPNAENRAGDVLTASAGENSGNTGDYAGDALVSSAGENSGNTENHAAPFLKIVSKQDIEAVRRLSLKMVGKHQWENGAAAMLAAEYLLSGEAAADPEKYADFPVEEVIRRGLERAVWPGRMEILSESPFLLVDGAHNGNGARALAESLAIWYPGEKFHFIMGVMAEKDYEAMIDALLPLAVDFLTVTPESSRALQGGRLADCIRGKGIPARAVQSVRESLNALPKDGKMIAFGSLYFVGEIKAIMQDFM